MKNRPFDERLELKVQILELKKREELQNFKAILHELRERVSLSNILRNSFHDFAENPEKRKKLLYGAGGILAFALLRKIGGKKVFTLGKILVPLVLLVSRIPKKQDGGH